MGKSISIFLAILSLVACGAASSHESSPSRLQAVVDAHEAQENTGLAAVLTRGGAIISEVYLGQAVVEHNVRVTPETRFQVMSVTKAFVGAALIKTETLGLVELDVPISTYMNELEGSPIGEATLDELASHTAGLSHLSHPGRKALYVERFGTASDATSTFIDLPLKYEVGQQYSYSSAGYNLIAAILERVHSKPFSDVLAQLVIEPLHMSSTEPGDVLKPMPDLARNYSYVDIWTYEPGQELQLVPTWEFSFNPGGGNLTTTARDLAMFGQAFTKPGFFTQAELERFMVPINSSVSSWGYGWFVTTNDDGEVVLSISGATPGVQAGLLVLPGDDVVISALANCWCKDSAGGDLVVAAPQEAARSATQ